MGFCLGCIGIYLCNHSADQGLYFFSYTDKGYMLVLRPLLMLELDVHLRRLTEAVIMSLRELFSIFVIIALLIGSV